MRWFPLFLAVPACAWLTDEEVAELVDADGDGEDSVAFGGEDCDDGDPDVGPGRQLSTRPVTVYVDADGDGLGWAATTTEACWPPDGYVAQAGDCDDTTTDVGEGWPQFHDDDGDGLGGDSGPPSSTCEGPDEGFVFGDTDCDDTDRDVGEVYPEQWQDGDDDGFGNPAAPQLAPTCRVAEGFVTNVDDCDDTSAAVGGPTHWYLDEDQDTYGVDGPETQVACGRPTHPTGGPMSANQADCDDDNVLVGVTALQFPDGDHDGFGDRDAMPEPSESCLPDLGFVSNATDCDDHDPLRNPNSVWYHDTDNDGLGAGAAIQQCLRAEEEGFGLVAGATDCDDESATTGDHGWEDVDGDTFGGTALEGCGGVYVPGDCDDTHPELHPGITWYADADGDGYPDEFVSTVSCEVVVDAIRDDELPAEWDCDDDDAAVNPETVWFPDLDQDGVGSGVGKVQCENIDPTDPDLKPMALVEGDCADDDPAVRDEPTYDDLDGDGWGGAEHGCAGDVRIGGDCDDSDLTVNPDTRWIEDVDGDGYAPLAGNDVFSCEPPPGHLREPSADAVDCDDEDATLNPTTSWWPDDDRDGAGDAGGVPASSCVNPQSVAQGYARDARDCADADPTVIDALPDVDGDGFGAGPGMPDHCLGGVVETGWVTLPGDCDDGDDDKFPGQSWFFDVDGDTFGGALIATTCQVSDPLAVVVPGDCDDLDPAVLPGVSDPPLDGIDANCDGTDLDGGDADHLPDLPCPGIVQHEVHSQAELDVLSPSLLQCDLVILHPPTDGVPYQGFTALADGYWAPEPGVVVEGGAGTGVVVEGGAVVLEGFELRGFEAGAVRLRADVDLTASDLRIDGGSGIVDELDLPSAGVATRDLTLVGVTFEDTDSLLAPGGQRTGQKSGVQVRSLSMLAVRAEGLVTTAIGLDVTAEQDIAVESLSLEHGAAFEGFVRLHAGTDLTLTGFELLDSLTARALDLRATNLLTLSGARVEDNGFLAASAEEAVISLRAPLASVERLDLLRNQGGGEMTWIEACGDEGTCEAGKGQTDLVWEGGEIVGNYASETTTVLRTFGDVEVTDVAIHHQEGTWWEVDGSVEADHVTFGGRPVLVPINPTPFPARFSLATSARVRLVASVLDYRRSDSVRLLDQGPLVIEGSLVESATVTWCGTSGSCSVTPGWTFTGAAGLRGSHVYMPNRDHDARLSTTSLAVANDPRGAAPRRPPRAVPRHRHRRPPRRLGGEVLR
jgi:hypothetical protein